MTTSRPLILALLLSTSASISWALASLEQHQPFTAARAAEGGTLGGGAGSWAAGSLGGGGLGGRRHGGGARAGRVLSGHDAGASDGGAAGGEGICTDTCTLARNGICEDGTGIGGGPTSRQVACDFGTDCSDCGPYKDVVPEWSDARFRGPIDFLTRAGVKVWARRVTLEPNFIFGYTDPKEDLDVSEQIDRVGCMELGIVQVFTEVLGQRCAPYRRNATAAGDGNRATVVKTPQVGAAPLVVDVGANFGYFSVYAAMMGCRVMAVEPVPRFLAFLYWNMAANGLRVTKGESVAAAAGSSRTNVEQAPVVVVERAVTSIPGVNVTMMAPKKGVWGTASMSSRVSFLDQEAEELSVQTVRLDDIVQKEHVTMLKVDVEGFEPLVMASGAGVLRERRVDNIVMEYSPGAPEILERMLEPNSFKDLPVNAADPPAMLLGLMQNGFSIALLPDNFAKSGYAPQLDSPIPMLEEVTRTNVMYDMADVERFRNYSRPEVTCPWPAELVAANKLAWSGCFKPPEDAHPKGLRVMFPFNTNLWAATNRSVLPLGGPVGLFAPHEDERTAWWSSTRADQGVGNRACSYLPTHQLVRSRCRCTEPDHCGLEEAALMDALARGRMP